MINPDVKSKVEAELRRGERLLWADKPAKFPLSFTAIYMTGFSFVWTLFAIGISSFGTVDVLFSAVTLLFVCVGVCMIFGGLILLIGPSKEIYAITNQRGFIIRSFPKYRITNLSAEILANSERKGRPEIGTLTFGTKSTGWVNPYQMESDAFYKINNPKKVEDLIHNTFFRKPTS